MCVCTRTLYALNDRPDDPNIMYVIYYNILYLCDAITHTYGYRYQAVQN